MAEMNASVTRRDISQHTISCATIGLRMYHSTSLQDSRICTRRLLHCTYFCLKRKEICVFNGILNSGNGLSNDPTPSSPTNHVLRLSGYCQVTPRREAA
ncbi:hypothetical protein TNCV_2979241 [Trichonephila clavipes]|nr:hypothetical protein TNCV_2979241 [Trichonephila clavipes]